MFFFKLNIFLKKLNYLTLFPCTIIGAKIILKFSICKKIAKREKILNNILVCWVTFTGCKLPCNFLANNHPKITKEKNRLFFMQILFKNSKQSMHF
jgi:hypothetical protein